VYWVGRAGHPLWRKIPTIRKHLSLGYPAIASGDVSIALFTTSKPIHYYLTHLYGILHCTEYRTLRRCTLDYFLGHVNRLSAIELYSLTCALGKVLTGPMKAKSRRTRLHDEVSSCRRLDITSQPLHRHFGVIRPYNGSWTYIFGISVDAYGWGG